MMGRYGHMNFLRIAVAHDRRMVDEALERVGMSDFPRRARSASFSGGQKKRVFLARALAQEGRIILLDEPFTGVDVKTEAAIIDLLRELRDAGHLMLVSTHNLGSVPDFCDQVVLVNRTVLAAGPTADVFTAGQPGARLRRRAAAFPPRAARRCTTTTTARVTVLTDDERPLVFYGDDREDARPSRKPPSGEKERADRASCWRRSPTTTWSRPSG